MKIKIRKSVATAVVSLALVSSAHADIECPAMQQLDVTQGLVQPLGSMAMTPAGLKLERGGSEGCRVNIMATGIPQATRSFVASQLNPDTLVTRFLITVNRLNGIEPQSPGIGGHFFTIAKIEFTKRFNGERAADLFVTSYSNLGGARIGVELKQADGRLLSGGLLDVAASGLGQVFEVRWTRDSTCNYSGNYDCTSTVSVYPTSGALPSSAPLFQYVFPKPLHFSYNFGIVPSRLVVGSQQEHNLVFNPNAIERPSLQLRFLPCYDNVGCTLIPEPLMPISDK